MMRTGARWGGPNSRRQWVILIVAQWIVVAAVIVVLGLIVGSRDSSAVLTRVVVPALILVLVATLCLAVVPLLFLPGRVRARVLSLRFPDSLVVNVSRAPELASALEQVAQIQLTGGISFSMVADSTGLSFWDGTRNPRLLATLTWGQIDKIEVGERKVRGIEAGVLKLRAPGHFNEAMFGLIPRSWFGVLPSGRAEAESIAARLSSLRG